MKMSKLIDRKLTKFLGEAASPSAQKQDFDGDVASLSANINDINKQTSNEAWKKNLAQMDLAYHTTLGEMNDKMGELARKMNTLFADFTKAYWNAANKEDEKGNLKGKFMSKVDDDATVTDDSASMKPKEKPDAV